MSAVPPSTRPLSQKLGMKPGHRVVLLDVPDDARALLEPLPAGATVVDAGTLNADVVVLFVRDRAALAERADEATGAMKPGALLWVCYPKLSGPLAGDLTRDAGWEPMHALGFDSVAQVAVDDVWSATRLRPSGDIAYTNKRRPPRGE